MAKMLLACKAMAASGRCITSHVGLARYLASGLAGSAKAEDARTWHPGIQGNLFDHMVLLIVSARKEVKTKCLNLDPRTSNEWLS